jgi:nucleoside 2-deoxyribosyltransferase
MLSMTPEKCPVCLNTDSRPAQLQARQGGYRVECPVCGRFAVSADCWEDYLDPEEGGRLFSTLCRARLAHRLRTGRSSDSASPPDLTSDFVERFIKDGCPGPSPAEQAVNLIRFVGDEVSRSGQRMKGLTKSLFAIIGSPSPWLAGELAVELLDLGFITGTASKSLSEPPTLSDVNLTLAGWERYEQEKRGQFAGKYGFVAMKFNDAVLDSFIADVVKPAVKKGIGYELVGMRDVARSGVIDNIMRAHIRDAAFVIADLTHDNSGAYWEAGYAEGLGKPVIYICECTKFCEDSTHFDTNHCTTVVWSEDNPEHFASELIATLRRSLNLFPEAP